MKRQIKFMDRKTLLRNVLTTALILGFSTAVSFAFYRISGNAENVTGLLYAGGGVHRPLYHRVRARHRRSPDLCGLRSTMPSPTPYFSLAFNLDGYPPSPSPPCLIIACLTSMTTTHLKEKNRILREQEKLLMEAEKEKMRANLLRAVSHDLRTPLTSIIGASSTYLENGSLPLRGGETADGADHLRTIPTGFCTWLKNLPVRHQDPPGRGPASQRPWSLWRRWCRRPSPA